MTVYTEALLVIDNDRKFDSIPVNALTSLGYRNIAHASFEDGVRAFVSLSRADAVVFYWNNNWSADAVALAVRHALEHMTSATAVMISSFCTRANVDIFRKAGVSAWVTVPFTRRDLDARLRYALEGERRQAHIPVLAERRRREPMPAFA
jgi:DNA-binding response OmpR family regulator